MENHYHLLIETPEGNLSLGMRQLNGVYTQTFNRRHDRVGHLFQGRFQAVLIQNHMRITGGRVYILAHALGVCVPYGDDLIGLLVGEFHVYP